MPEDIEMTRMEAGAAGPSADGQKKEKNKPKYELEDTDYRPVNWKKLLLSWKYLPWHILAIVIGVLTILVAIHHDEVVNKLRPFSEHVRDLPAGFLIPIAILIIISFPPLFGHEIVALMCGIVYGLWIGFGIVAAGTFLGEIGTWFAFKYAFRRKAAKLERTNLNYGALARMTRDGGFWVVLIVRFSAIPSHFSTAVFSTCDVNFWFFVISTFFSLPKQIFLVYLGVLFSHNTSGAWQQAIIYTIVFFVTVGMGVYIYMKMRTVKKVLLEEQAERRKARMKAEELEMRMDGERMQGQASGQYGAAGEGSWKEEGQRQETGQASSPYHAYSSQEEPSPYATYAIPEPERHASPYQAFVEQPVRPERPDRPQRPERAPYPYGQQEYMPEPSQYQAYSMPPR